MPLPDLSMEDKQLHSLIIDLRDTILAHSDISSKEAKLYIGKIGDQALPLIISSNIELRLPNLAAVRGLIERTLDKLYEQLPVWEKRLTSQM